MPVNIHLSNSSSRSIVSIRTSIVTQDRDNDSRVSGLVDHVLEIFAVREFLAAAGSTVFIFWLIQNNGTTFGNLILGDQVGDVGNIAVFYLLVYHYMSNCTFWHPY